MMDYLATLGLNYWLIGFCVSLAVNIWQALYHTSLKATLGHVLTFGHAPEGAVVMPLEHVAPTVPPWERKL